MFIIQRQEISLMEELSYEQKAVCSGTQRKLETVLLALFVVFYPLSQFLLTYMFMDHFKKAVHIPMYTCFSPVPVPLLHSVWFYCVIHNTFHGCIDICIYYVI